MRFAARFAIVFIASSSQAMAQELENVCDGDVALHFSLPSFETFDANDDGALDEREVAECNSLSMLFSRLDLDANDVLTPVEYQAFPALWRRRQRTFDDAE